MNGSLGNTVFALIRLAKSCATFLKVVILLVLLAACSKPPYDPATTITLVGTWKQTTEFTSDCGDPFQNILEVPCTNCITLIMNTGTGVKTWSSTGAASGPATGTWTSAGYYTIPTGFVSFDTNGIGSILASFSMTPTNLILVTESNIPGPGCKLNQRFTRQK